MFYIEDTNNNKIILASESLTQIVRTQKFLPVEFQVLEIKETDDNHTIIDNQIVTIEEAEEINRQKEENRINNLTMTSLDLITAIKSMGVTDQQIEDFLNAHLSIKHQLEFCQNVYCGVVRSLLPINIGTIEITDSMVIQLFKNKHKEQ